ncbi:MAG: ABC transporter ATP-binding protein [Candidatus Heimdallarchaeota archaeon]|nr:MAG: ABC transporter ATP-binding protein [Candidatus Heimdallarchaeota archaeon]
MSKKASTVSIDTKELIKDFNLPGGEVVNVLTGVDLRIKRGEFIAIMGPSGSGKSTLLNILSTLESITSGEVLVAGINLSETSYKEKLEIRRTKTSVVFQNFALIPYLTAKENVKLPMKLRKVPELEADQKAIEYLESVGLYVRMDHLPEELSGGEQQRVAIARALAHNPAIIYADEPTGNLDTQIGKEIILLFKQLAREKKITVIMVTHDSENAKEADKILILQKGNLIQEQPKKVAKKKSKKEGIK